MRKKFRALRKNLKSAADDARILENFLASPFLARRSFFVYCSVGSEVDTTALIATLLERGKEVLVPRIEEEGMLAVPYGKLSSGKFGIPAPADGEDTPCEVALVPLLAFDGAGNRLGCGGGYYDAYFHRRACLRVGLAYAGQRADALPAEPHDVPLDAVVTEKGTVFFGKGRALS